MQSSMEYSDEYLSAFAEILKRTEVSDTATKISLQNGLECAVNLLREIQRSGRAQHFLGNGASAAIAEHMALDWTKNAGVRSTSPSSWVLLTALANDLSYEDAFAVYVDRYAQPGDLVVTISSSGNSTNIQRAIVAARERQCPVVTFSGLKPDNASRSLGDLNFYVPAKTYGLVECAHQVLLHMIIDAFMGIQEWNREGCQNMSSQAYQL